MSDSEDFGSEGSFEESDVFESEEESDGERPAKKAKKTATKAKAAPAAKTAPANKAKTATASTAKVGAKRKTIDSDDDAHSDGSGDGFGGKPAAAAKKPAPAAPSRPALAAAAPKPASASSNGGGNSNLSASVSLDASAGDEAMALTHGPDVTSESAAKKLVLRYFQLQNRPYSALQIYDNFHKRIPKSTVERVLASLCENQGGLCGKEYGKAKIFYMDQNLLPSNVSEHELAKLDNELGALKAEVDAAAATERELQAELNKLLAEPLDDELDRLLKDLEDSVNAKRVRFRAVEASTVDADTIQHLIKAHNTARTAWKTRKEQCMDLVESICESSNKKTKDMLSEMGIETDEDYKVQCPAPIVDLKKK